PAHARSGQLPRDRGVAARLRCHASQPVAEIIMTRRILVIDGHPDPAEARFVHALARAYERGAQAGGHEVRVLRVASLKLDWLRSGEDLQKGKPPAAISRAQESVAWAEHLVILYPLW